MPVNGTFFEKYRTAAADAREVYPRLWKSHKSTLPGQKLFMMSWRGYYVPAVDFDKIEQLRCQVVQRILKYEWDN